MDPSRLLCNERKPMKTTRFHSFGPPDVLSYEEVPDPAPELGEAVVQVRAAGVNHVDLDMRSGVSRLDLKLPHILGREFAGEVANIQKNGSPFREGDRVWVVSRLNCFNCRYCHTGQDNLCESRSSFGAHLPGGYAEQVKVPITSLRHLPAHITFEAGAAFQIAFGTAWHVLVSRSQIKPGQKLLILGAGSGVGSAAIQVGHLAGATVFATSTSDTKLEKAKCLGAEHVINTSEQNIMEYVMEHTGGEGVDVVMDNIGGELFLHGLECLKQDGGLVLVGAHGGEVIPLDLIPIFRKELRIIGSRNATLAELTKVMNLVGQGKLTPIVHKTIPLEKASLAHNLLATRQVFGKLLLIP
jgi:NADPH:quinone reductase-like Zn-dependent oxidoreductase